MNTPVTLPDDLIKAARGLQERFELLQVPSRQVPEDAWKSLPAEILASVPDWIPALLKEFKLIGGALFYPDTDDTCERSFSFWEPATFQNRMGEGSLYRRLNAHGLLPFAEECNGNIWLATVEKGSAGPIYLLVHTNWDGGFPSDENGLTFAASRLSFLLASMAISPESYGGCSRSFVLWHSET